MANIEWIADSTKAWSDTTAWQGGALPTTGDNAIFDQTHVGDVTNLATGVGDPDNVYVKQGYTGKMGTSGNPLEVNCTQLNYAGSGTEAWFTSTVDSVVAHHQGQGTSALNLTLTMSGAQEYVACTNGRTNLFGALETLIVTRDTTGNLPTVVVDSTATQGNEVYMHDGSLTLENSISVGFHQTGGIATLTNAGTYGFLDITGGRCNVVVAGDVTVNQCNVNRGGLNLTGVDGDLTFNGVNIVGPTGFMNIDNGRNPTTGGSTLFLVASGGTLKYFAQTITPVKV